MIANFFNKTKPVVIFIIVLLFFSFFVTATFLFKFDMFSTAYLFKRIGVFCCFAIFLLVVNFIIHKNHLTRGNAYSLLIIVLLFATFYETLFSNKLLFSNLALLFGFRKIYSLRTGTKTKLKLFDAGFWVGVATVIYAWSFFYLALIYLAIIINQKVEIKNLFIPIIGLLAPIFIFFTYCFYFDQTSIFIDGWYFYADFDFRPYNQLKLLLPITFIAALAIWSIVLLTPTFMNKGINSKRSWRIILNHLIISAIIILFSPIKNGSEMFFLLFPLSIIVANFLEKSESNNFKNLIMYLFVIIAFAVYFL